MFVSGLVEIREARIQGWLFEMTGFPLPPVPGQIHPRLWDCPPAEMAEQARPIPPFVVQPPTALR